MRAGRPRSKPTTPTTALLPAAATAHTVARGRIGDVKRIDTHGYRATLHTDRVLAGATRPGSDIVIGWEELSPSRPVRFADGDTVLVALGPLPSASLWRKRFAEEKASPFVVAADGDAFLTTPTAAEADALLAYLTAAAKAQATALARIIEQSPRLTPAAVAMLAHASPPPEASAILARVADDAKRDRADRATVIALAGNLRLSPMRPTLAKLAQPGEGLEAEALAALIAIDGGLDPTQAKALLARKEPGVRAVAARNLRGLDAERELPRLVRSDPAPQVRLAAAEALAAAGTVWGIEGALPALADPDAGVRNGAARALAARGNQSLPYLKTALRGDAITATGAIVTLSMMGKPGLDLIAVAAKTHPDEKVRTVAKLALGQAPGHSHAH